MKQKAMKLLIIEDDKEACISFERCAKKRDDIEIAEITDSDIEAIEYVRAKHPEGIVLDLELNNGSSGSTNSLEFLDRIKELNLNYEPIIIVTTHINSKRTYDILHKNGVDLILYKDHPSYSTEHVLNSFINLRKNDDVNIRKIREIIDEKIKENEDKISKMINNELDLIGIVSKLKGREYLYDAILYLIESDSENRNAISYLASKYDKTESTITTGMKKAINHAWNTMAIDDLEKYYTNRVNYETGVPTPMEFVYYYVKKIKKEI